MKAGLPGSQISVGPYSLQRQTGRANVDLAFVQRQPLPPYLTVPEELLFIQHNV